MLSSIHLLKDSLEKGGDWRKVSVRLAPMPGGVGEASHSGQGASLARPLGSRFAAAMLRHAYGPMHVPKGGGGGPPIGDIP